MIHPTVFRAFRPSHSIAALGLLAVSGLTLAGPATAGCFPNQCGWSSCHMPARGVPAALWGELRPADVGRLPFQRDSTNFDQLSDYEPHPYWMSLDVENGWIFAVANRRFQIWNARANPGNPNRTFDRGFRQMGLQWTDEAHGFYPIRDVDAPPGEDGVAAMAVRDGAGVVIWNTANKAAPSIVYQDHGPDLHKWAYQTYATTLGGRHYAFAAAESAAGGLYAYDLSAALELTARCTEGQPGAASSCPGVYLGKIGERPAARYVDGAGDFVVVSSGSAPRGFEIWHVADPTRPELRMDALASEPVYGVALWRQGENFYLALRTALEARIYDVSCVRHGFCLPANPLWRMAMPFSAEPFVTFSRGGATPFLYFGAQNDCLFGLQSEWLFDVTDPTAPRDISPPGTVILDGEAVSYWGWYYRRNGTHGFNYVGPRVGKFHGDHFYRAATAIFDIHRRQGVPPPPDPTLFSDGFESGNLSAWTAVVSAP